MADEEEEKLPDFPCLSLWRGDAECEPCPCDEDKTLATVDEKMCPWSEPVPDTSKRIEIVVTMEVEIDADPSGLAMVVDGILRDYNEESGIHGWVLGIDKVTGHDRN